MKQIYALHVPRAASGTRTPASPPPFPTFDIITLSLSLFQLLSSTYAFTFKMTSNPPASCCTVGVKHEGEAKGEFQQIGDGISPLLEQPQLNR